MCFFWAKKIYCILLLFIFTQNFFSEIKIDGFNGGVSSGELKVGEGEAGEGKKERSVLQAKLTRLAIQIGYAGK